MLRTSRLLLLPLLASLASLGCSDDPAAPTQRAGDTGGTAGTPGAGLGGAGTGGSPTQGEGGAAGDTGTAGTAGTGGVEDPGGKGETKVYPAGPYGLAVGDVIRNLSFQGLENPKAVDYKTDQTAKISFSDYYNPDGDLTKPRVLVVTGAARWCAPCKDEASKSMGYYKYWSPKGAEFLSAVIDNEEYGPADFNDLSLWADAYNLEYPVTIDPSPPQLGAYFGADAVPFNMVIDLKTMKILYKIAGSVVFDKNNPTLKKALPE
ncbi:MAG: redoxin domain-containing protein [Myxococcales bacterium]|nr:MAG: redoxin domain-containing protein [Myxococcales bacterium]